MSRFGNGSSSNGQFWFGGNTFPGFLYKKNVGVGGRRATKFAAGGNSTTNTYQYIYNKYKPGNGGIGASSMSNRRAKNRLATVCLEKNCFPCYTTLGQYSNYTHNPNGFVPCLITVKKDDIITDGFLVYQPLNRGPNAGILNTNFGWDSNGVWFSGTSTGPAYPIFTNFNISKNKKVVVSFDFVYNDNCSDMGMCFYSSSQTPIWKWDYDPTRIACQYDCSDPVIFGLQSGEVQYGSSILTPTKTYKAVIIYDPSSPFGDTITFKTYLNFTLINQISLTNITKLNSDYKIGFTADQDNSSYKTYMKNLIISVNNGETIYKNDLRNIDIPKN